ncbi:MAG TPA: acyltransferase [Acidimicrobiia bacterium]|nr:acyltransferase [Acidimicrobiia bacterium]
MKRIPALDGLRAVAIAMVFAYHVDKGVVPAGYWGVILFFVLSGYLITRVLVAGKERNGGIDLRTFYSHRALRLFPALTVVCLALIITGTDWLTVLPALGHYANFARIDGFDLGLLTHTWFLAVLLHFYLLWPLVIAAVPARHRLRAIGAIALAAIAWRVVAIGVMSEGWVYNATDTNAAAILAGCYLAVARPRTWAVGRWSVPALLALMLFPAFGEEGNAFLWADFVAIGLATLAVQDAALRRSWLALPPIVWLGTISYGLYLWHYVFLRSGVSAWLTVPLTIATAAASRYLLEEPLRRWQGRLEVRRLGASTVAGTDAEDGASVRDAAQPVV